MADSRDSDCWSNHARECRDAGRVPFEFTKDNPFRLVAKELKKNGCKDVLDLGCGPGYWSGLWKGFSYLGYDQNEEMIKLAREVSPKLSFICASDPSILPSQSEDVIFTAGVLQHNRHNPDKVDLIKHIWRILRPNGYYFCTENTFRADNMPASIDNPDYTDGYSFTPTGWKKFIEGFGFTFIHYTAPSEYLYQKIVSTQ